MLALPLAPLLTIALLAVGILLIMVEFHRPGYILPGALGLLATLLAAASVARSPHPLLPLLVLCLAGALTAANFRRPTFVLEMASVLSLWGAFRLIAGPVHPAWLRWLCGLAGGAVGILNMQAAKIAYRARINKGHAR